MPVRFCIALLLAAVTGATYAQVKVGLMVSATGPTTAIGIPQKNTGELLPRSRCSQNFAVTASYM